MTTTNTDPRVARSRRTVLQAARELLVERGVAATTVEAISEQSGVAKTTIYRHWDGKGAIVIDVLDSLQGTLQLPDTGSFAGDLRAVAAGLASGLEDSVWSALLPSLIDAAERDMDLAERLDRFAADRHRVLKQIIERGRDRGEIRDDVGDEDVLELVAGPLFYRRLITRQGTPVSYASHIVDMVVAMVSPKNPEIENPHV